MSGATWLASYPRSGNTWARFALMAATEPEEAATLKRLTRFGAAALDRGAIDYVMESESDCLTAEETALLRADYHELLFTAADPSPLVKVHDRWTALPGGRSMHAAGFTHAAIYIVRDPRDVAISWAALMGKPIDWAISFMDDPASHVGAHKHRRDVVMPEHVGTWSGHVKSWLDDAPFAPLVIRYEDMLAEAATCVRQMLAEAGRSAEPACVRAAIENSRFDRLAALEREEGYEDRPRGGQRFFRAGRSGSWHDILSQAQAGAIARSHGETMLRLGYSLDAGPVDSS